MVDRCLPSPIVHDHDAIVNKLSSSATRSLSLRPVRVLVGRDSGRSGSVAAGAFSPHGSSCSSASSPAVGAIGSSSESSFESPDSDSLAGFEILKENFGVGGSFLSGSIVFEAEQGVDDPDGARPR